MTCDWPGCTWRACLASAVSVTIVLAAALSAVAAPWWWTLPAFAGDEDAYIRYGGNMGMTGVASDPCWGGLARQLTVLDGGLALARLRQPGSRWITWVEGFGDTMLYAASFQWDTPGRLRTRSDDVHTPWAVRNAWCWYAEGLPAPDIDIWLGAHNATSDDPIARSGFAWSDDALPEPTYPDGRSALGVRDDLPCPLNARIYDALCSKDVYGRLAPNAERPQDRPESVTPEADQGLLTGVVGGDLFPRVAGVKSGDSYTASVLSLGKDIAAPWWAEYVRTSVRAAVRQGLNGFWVDNWSAWDNLGGLPVERAFGEWSVAGFRRYLAGVRSRNIRLRGMPEDLAAFDVRHWLQRRVRAFGGGPGRNLADPAWQDSRWLDEPLWLAYLVWKQEAGSNGLQRFYQAVKAEAARAGNDDFLVSGNDIPVYSMAWARPAWTDMVSTELTHGWGLMTGARGTTLPPHGRLSPVYRTLLEHQSGPWGTVWLYMNAPYHTKRQAPGLTHAIYGEALASNVIPKTGGHTDYFGDEATRAVWMQYMTRQASWYGARRPWAAVGLLWSTSSRLASITPGGVRDMNRLEHLFEYLGWATALDTRGYQWRAVPDWQITDDTLAPFTTLIVPGASALDDATLQALHRAATRGARVVFTGRCTERYGVSGLLQRRPAASLPDWWPASTVTALTRPVGRGLMIWNREPLGEQYYAHIPQRQRLVQVMTRLSGRDPLLSLSPCKRPALVSLWRDTDTVWLDAASMDVTSDGATLRPVGALTSSIPWSGALPEVDVQAPTGSPQAAVRRAGSRCQITLTGVEGYASVRLSPRSMR